MKSLTKLATACLLAFAASASQAAIVDSWVYDIDMEWVTTGSKAPVFNPGTGTYTSNATTLSWGYAKGTDGVLTSDSDRSRSSLIIGKPHDDGTIATGSTVQQVNMFTHTNNALNGGFTNLSSANLKVSVNLSPEGSPLVDIPTSKTFSVLFYETPNVGGTCAWGNCDDDIFVFATEPEIYQQFTYDGQVYQLNYFQPGDLIEFSADVCGAVNAGLAGKTCYGFTTQESAKTTLQFDISISAVPVVPEPETYAMLLAGLGVIGIVARRRRNVIHS